MKDAIKSTRTSRRLAEMRWDDLSQEMPSVGAENVSGKSTGTAETVIEVEKYNLVDDVFMPCWSLSKHMRLTTLDEREEWVENVLSPRAKTKFKAYKDTELGKKIDYTIYEVCYYPVLLIICLGCGSFLIGTFFWLIECWSSGKTEIRVAYANCCKEEAME